MATTYKYKIYYDDSGAWTEIDDQGWTLERGIGREIYAPILTFKTDISVDISENTDILLIANYDTADEDLIFAGYTKSGGKKKKGGTRKYTAYHDFYKHSDEKVNFTDIAPRNYLELTDEAGARMYNQNITSVDDYIPTHQSSTYSFFYKTDGTTDTAIANIFMLKDNSSGLGVRWLEYDGTDIKFNARYYDDDGKTNAATISTNYPIDDDEWHLIGISIRSTSRNEIKLYIDGDARTTESYPADFDHWVVPSSGDLDFYVNDDIKASIYGFQIFDSGKSDYYYNERLDKWYHTGPNLTKNYEMQSITDDNGDSYTLDEEDGDKLYIGDHSLVPRTWAHTDILKEAFPDSYSFNITHASSVTLPAYVEEDSKVKNVMQNVIDRSHDYIVFEDSNKGSDVTVWVIDPSSPSKISLSDYDVLEWESGEIDSVINKVLLFSPKLDSSVDQPIIKEDSTSISNLGEYAFIYNLEYIDTKTEAEDMANELLSPSKKQEGEIFLPRSPDNKIDMMSARQTDISSNALDISATDVLIRKEKINQGYRKLMVGLGGLFGIQADEREKRSNRWKE